jgi:hypothetical protein
MVGVTGRPTPEPFGEPGVGGVGGRTRTSGVPHSATAQRLLLSGPGDVPLEDIRIVVDAVNRRNAVYGRQFASVVVPIHWSAHAASEHGVRPQASLNRQLVDDCDGVLALRSAALTLTRQALSPSPK